MNNPTKIIIIDFKNIEQEAADYFGVSLEKVEKRHTKIIKRLFHSKGSQWILAEERGRNL